MAAASPVTFSRDDNVIMVRETLLSNLSPPCEELMLREHVRHHTPEHLSVSSPPPPPFPPSCGISERKGRGGAKVVDKYRIRHLPKTNVELTALNQEDFLEGVPSAGWSGEVARHVSDPAEWRRRRRRAQLARCFLLRFSFCWVTESSLEHGAVQTGGGL